METTNELRGLNPADVYHYAAQNGLLFEEAMELVVCESRLGEMDRFTGFEPFDSDELKHTFGFNVMKRWDSITEEINTLLSIASGMCEERTKIWAETMTDVLYRDGYDVLSGYSAFKSRFYRKTKEALTYLEDRMQMSMDDDVEWCGMCRLRITAADKPTSKCVECGHVLCKDCAEQYDTHCRYCYTGDN